MNNNMLVVFAVVFVVYIIYKHLKKQKMLVTLKNKIEENKNIIFLDVRTQGEYLNSSLVDSINIPLDQLNRDVLKQIPNKETEIIVYCLSGARSRMAFNILKRLGYKNVLNAGSIQIVSVVR
jgi:rhodanese-related sulfurtransferase